MSNGITKDVSGSSLLRTRSAGDPSFSRSDLGVPQTGASHMSSDHFFSSTVITIPKRASRGPHSAGPSFNAFFPGSIPEKRENQVIAAIRSSPRIPSPAILHPPPTPIPTNNTIPAPPLRRPVHTHHSPVARLLHFLGYGNDASKVRKELVSLIWRLGWGFAQMVGIVVVLALFAPKASPTVPGANEWTACNRPLGVWSCLWLGRIIVACVVACWGWTRDRSTQNRNTRIDPESGQRASNSEHLEQTRSHNPQQPPFPSINSPQTQNDHLPHTVMFRSRYGIYCSFALQNPIQNPQMIRPDIKKLPKNLVDRILLVVYIPTFPDASPAEDLYKCLQVSIHIHPSFRQDEYRGLDRHDRKWLLVRQLGHRRTPSCRSRRQSCRVRKLSGEPKRLHIVGEEQSKGGQGKAEGIMEEKYENDELRSADGDEGAQLLRLLRCGRETEKEEI
ncbi:hypothetical protein EV359DRAFT_79431 [Lentinula novae-zelandiae]|nr:hypothetical protein EV359DRAFT_79431 [Lentinula novae-zelandiae]